MQEDVENKTVQLAIRGVKLTFKGIYRVWKKFMAQEKKVMDKAIQKLDEPKKGKQSVKELIGQGQGVSAVDISETGLKDFKRVASKYGVDFAIVKDKNVFPPKYTIFFKAKDADAIDKAMNEYAAKQLKKEREGKRPSVLKKLQEFKDKVAATPYKQREKRKELDR